MAQDIENTEDSRLRLAQAIAKSEFSATSLARKIGRDGTYIRDYLKNKKDTLGAAEIDAIEQVLGFRFKTRPKSDPVPPPSLDLGSYTPPPQLLGDTDLKVFSSVEGGPGDMTVFSTDPYEIVSRPWYVFRDPDAFGVYLTGDSMEPVYQAGQIIIVSPRAPLIKGKDVIMTAEPVGGDFRASLKRYRGQTDKHWLAKQYNPERDLEFERQIWRKAYRVLGRYDG